MEKPLDFIVTRAPFRISFAGGGTDLPSFYQRDYGAVVSTTIDKYVYVIINRCRPIFQGGVDDSARYRIRLSYAFTENVQTPNELQHPIVREALQLLDLDIPLDIATMADIPAGNGLGSSGAFTVALLQALHLAKGEKPDPELLGEEAAKIEIDILRRPVGKQDHYSAAFGGMNTIQFLRDGTVDVQPLEQPAPSQLKLFDSLMLLYTGTSRDAGSVLTEQRDNTLHLIDELKSMRDHALRLKKMLNGGFCVESFGEVLHGNWMRKRGLASNITSDKIDCWYQKALDAGASGGKICGAGGGGFLLLVVDPKNQANVRQALAELSELTFGYQPRGSEVLLPRN